VTCFSIKKKKAKWKEGKLLWTGLKSKRANIELNGLSRRTPINNEDKKQEDLTKKVRRGHFVARLGPFGDLLLRTCYSGENNHPRRQLDKGQTFSEPNKKLDLEWEFCEKPVRKQRSFGMGAGVREGGGRKSHHAAEALMEPRQKIKLGPYA